MSTVYEYLLKAIYVREMLFYQNFREEASFTDVALNQILRSGVTICKIHIKCTIKCHAEHKLIFPTPLIILMKQ